MYIDPRDKQIAILFKINKKLVAQHEIDEYIKKGLFSAIKLKQTKRKRGKKLNLRGKETIGVKFYSLKEIQEAREFQRAKEAEIEAEKARKLLEKVAKEAKKAEEAI